MLSELDDVHNPGIESGVSDGLDAAHRLGIVSDESVASVWE